MQRSFKRVEVVAHRQSFTRISLFDQSMGANGANPPQIIFREDSHFIQATRNLPADVLELGEIPVA
jgi:hypothetical protein